MGDNKVVLLGDAGVGKTCLCEGLRSRAFNAQTEATIGAHYKRIPIVLDGVTVCANVWDTAGQEQFRQLVPLYLRDVTLALMCFSVDDETSLANVEEWTKMLWDAPGGRDALIGLIECKVDIPSRVGAQQIEDIAQAIGASFVCETSGKTGEGLEGLATHIATRVKGRSRSLHREVALKRTPRAEAPAECC